MPSIPQLAATIEHVLTDVARQAARSTGFIKRQRAFDGAQFVQLLVFGWLADPHASLADLALFAADLGISISPQALDQRFTPAAVACLEQVLHAALAQVIAADPCAIPLLDRFPHVLIHDTTTISLPDALAATFRGCGGSHGTVAAAVKAHLRLDARTGQLEGPLLQDGRASDRALCFRRRPPSGSLTLRDLGFFQLDDLAADQRDGQHWLGHLKPNTAVFHDGERLDLATFLPLQQSSTLDLNVTIGVKQRIACRLLAVAVPEAVAQRRRERLRKDARDKQYRLRPERLLLCGWTLMITTLRAEELSVQEALVLLKLRWQIELLHKLWKSHGGVDETRGERAARVQCELYAKFLGMVIEHWLLVTGCWETLERSLVKAAKVVRTSARRLARAMGRSGRLHVALREVMKWLARAGRQTKRRKDPNTYQLLLDPTLLSLT